MSRGLSRLLVAVVVSGLAHGIAVAQTGSGTAPLSGQVTDQDGAVAPGVTVVVKNQATGVALAPVVTNREGIFSVAALEPGTYTVTFSLTGFKTAVVKDVQIVTATPTDLKVTLEVGPITETVDVQARSSVIQTRSTAISSTLYADQIRNLPLNTRDALNFVTLLPGVDTGSTHVQRNSTLITGLPLAAILVSIDGVPTQSPLSKSQDGFWSIISPNIDAMEEVTISTATPGADASGQGAIQIRFTTKSGTDKYAGSFFETWRHPAMYANTFFNKVGGLPVSHIVVNDFGGNVGGPFPLPGSHGSNRAFFFTNLDWLNQASELRRVRTVLSPSARAGLFTYTGGGSTRTIDVLALAGQNGQVGTADPTISGLLSEMAAATASAGSLEVLDGNTLRYAWNSPDELLRRHSTTRIDVDLGPARRVSGTYNFNKYRRNPDTLTNRDPRLPGLPARGSNTSFRNAASSTLRTTLSPSVVNEATFGAFWQTNDGGPELTPASFANQGGYTLTLAAGGSGVFAGLTPATPGMGTEANGNGNRKAENPNVLWSLADRLSWQRGRHGLQIGGELTRVKSQRMDQQVVPAVAFGIVPGDPADAVFKPVNFPAASTTNVADAGFLYALLTGRVASITTEFALDPETGQYVKNARTDRRTHLPEMGLFVQDAFRVSPNLTLNLGLRYELQFPMRADNSVYAANTITDACGLSGLGPGPGGRPCNFFMPGTLTGTAPDYEQYRSGTTRYGSDLNNLAPSAGVAWLPGVKTGFLRAVLGDPDQATLRASYARAYYREGLNRYAVPYENNPGASDDDVRNAINGNLAPPGEVLLFRTGKLGPAEVPLPPSYPLAIDRTAGVNMFDPHWEVGYADSFSAGIQRSLSRDMAIEVRYVGTRGRNLIEIENWNEINLIENGFLDEFRLAQANLAANIAAGNGNTIVYRGPGTGTSPLPTYLAYFTGSRNASDPTAYAASDRWNNGTVVGRFAPFNPNPAASAGDLQNDATQRANALRAGVPANFFVLSPDVTSVNVHVSKGSTRYDAIQFELRRRLSGGLAATASYSYVKMWASRLDTLRRDRVLAPAAAAVPHSLKVAASYDVPFGRARRFGADIHPWVQAIAGGWSVNVTGKITSGQMLSFGNVRLVGMTRDELQRSIEYRIESVNPDGTPGPTRVYNLPQDIIDNTIKAFSVNLTGYSAGAPAGRYFAPANGPDCIQAIRGDCAPADIQAVAPPYSRFDFGARKRLGLGGKVTLLVEVDVLNLFNAINFNPIALPANPGNRAGYQIAESYSDVNNLADPGSRIGQLVFRLNW